MECKVKSSSVSLFPTPIKVEPYWNVKEAFGAERIRLDNIKVEPYWNVKFAMIVEPPEVFPIKVEPYWNVKTRMFFA